MEISLPNPTILGVINSCIEHSAGGAFIYQSFLSKSKRSIFSIVKPYTAKQFRKKNELYTCNAHPVLMLDVSSSRSRIMF